MISSVSKFKVGDRVRFKKDVDRFPQTIVRRGETGTVARNEKGLFTVKLDRHHEALDEWANDGQEYTA